MNTIEYKGKEYQISDKIAKILNENTEYLDFIIGIIKSKNYNAGKIKDNNIIQLLHYNVFMKNAGKEILTSKIYGDGLISNSLFFRLIDIHDVISFSILEEEYVKGDFRKDDAEIIFKIMNKADSSLTIIKIIRIALEMTSSKIYKEKRITKETLELLDGATDNSLEMLRKAFTYDFRNYVDEETIKQILQEEQNELINAIIEYIMTTNIIKPEEKNYYIQVMINLKNKEALNNLYDLYTQKDKYMILSDFVKNFVRFTLVLNMQQFNSTPSSTQYTKK